MLAHNIFLFVGEQRSPRAIALGVKWQDGALAAKQLFDALRACGLDPHQQCFVNLFERGGLSTIKRAQIPIIAMGRKVQAELKSRRVSFSSMVHPAARGSIRKKELYSNHVREVLERIL